jgi:ankyrin repeat protein
VPRRSFSIQSIKAFMNNAHSFRSRFCQSTLHRCTAVLLVALAGSSWAFGDEIHDAAKKGDAAKVKALLSSNPALVASKDNVGRTPLHIAALFGRKEVVVLLLANKAEVNARAKQEQTALLWAASEGHAEVVELLLTNKAEVNAVDKNGWTPLHKAAEGGHKEVVELLLANKAAVDARNIQGATPLMAAAGEGRKEVAAVLLASKADVNAKDNKHGWTPMGFAVARFHQDVVELLRQNGGHE